MQSNNSLFGYVALICAMVLIWKPATGKLSKERKPIEELEENKDVFIRPEPIIYGLSPEQGQLVLYYKAIMGYQITSEDFFWNNLHNDKVKKIKKEQERLKRRGFIEDLFRIVKKVIPKPFGVSDFDHEKNAKQTRYLIRHKSGEDAHFEMNRDPSRADDHWKSGGPLVLFIHGFNSIVLGDADMVLKRSKMLDLSNSFSKYNASYNIIIVDWWESATYHLSEYYIAVESTKFVGEDVGRFLIKLKEVNMITDWDQVYLVGFSLGAHVAGVAGQYVKRNGGGSIGRITGLDPAGPKFEEDGKMLANPYYCLDSSDATFVDIIHCNMMTTSIVLPGRLGSRIQAGHADFYPNGGEDQNPYCENEVRNLFGCSHSACPTIYIKSMTEDVYACSCDSWTKYLNKECGCDQGQYDGVKMVKFGVDVPRSARGKYQLVFNR